MVRLYDGGVYLLNGTEIVNTPEEVKAKTGQEASSKKIGRAHV